MPQLSLIVWIEVGVALLLTALCAVTIYATLRRRAQIAQWPARLILTLFVLAMLPWLTISLAVHNVSVNVSGIGSFIGWLAIALLVFALLVLFPLATLIRDTDMVARTASDEPHRRIRDGLARPARRSSGGHSVRNSSRRVPLLLDG